MIKFDDQLNSFLDSIISRFKKSYDVIGEGRFRIVFRKDEKTVIKIPKSAEGIDDNEWEFKVFKKYGKNNEVKYAECNLLFIEENIPILEMEYVNVVKCSKNLPSWTMSIDCSQVGYNSDGELLAYDFGIH